MNLCKSGPPPGFQPGSRDHESRVFCQYTTGGSLGFTSHGRVFTPGRCAAQPSAPQTPPDADSPIGPTAPAIDVTIDAGRKRAGRLGKGR